MYRRRNRRNITRRDEVDAAAEMYLATEPEPARAMFDHLYAAPPADIAALAEELGDG